MDWRRSAFVLRVLVFLLACSGPAFAIDCTHATSVVEKTICSNETLRKLDAALSTAYFALLKSTQDKDFHDALIMSQRRWLKARETRLYDPLDSQSPLTNENLVRILSSVIQLRLKQIIPSPHTSEGSLLIHTMESERKLYAPFTGGPFSGFVTGCYFKANNNELFYTCEGSATLQNKDRIWRDNGGSNWNSYLIGNVVGGAVKWIAYCGIDIGGPRPCFGQDDEKDLSTGDFDWYQPPEKPEDELGFQKNDSRHLVLKYDPDTFAASDPYGILAGRVALTDPTYPKLIRRAEH